jgi:VWFA-related protein
MARTRSPFLSIPLLLALAATATPAVRSQQETPPAGSFAERLEVSEALLDVLVTDRDGNVVLGLGPADFRVTVDGKQAEVTAASFYSNRRFLDSAAAARLGLDPSAVPDRRTFVLFFDDQRLEAFDNPQLRQRQLQAGRDAVAWLQRELGANDRVAVVSHDVRLKLQQDLTGDLGALERAVERAARGQDPPEDWPSRRRAPGDEPSFAAALPPPAELARATADVHRAVTVLADAARAVPGRKNLVLFTIGFGDRGPGGVFRPDPRYEPAMIRALNSANVAVYTVDLVPFSTRHQLEGFFGHLAGATGGLPFLDVVSFSIPLERIARETNGYYLVSVRVRTAPGDDGYREAAVEVSNPEFRVRSRGGIGFAGGR